MDNIKDIHNIVYTLLHDIAETFRKNSQWGILEAYDEKRGQYLLFTDGWNKSIRDYGCFMHIEIKENGKIWLRRDGTDLNIGQQLLESGIKPSQLVLAFHSPAMRALSDFAVA
jgi:hypothetical protein